MTLMESHRTVEGRPDNNHTSQSGRERDETLLEIIKYQRYNTHASSSCSLANTYKTCLHEKTVAGVAGKKRLLIP